MKEPEVVLDLSDEPVLGPVDRSWHRIWSRIAFFFPIPNTKFRDFDTWNSHG